MKLHLPKSLRTALLTCLAALAPVAVTLATGAISSGLVAFSISSAYAVDETGSLTSDTNWNATTDHSADTTTVSGATLKVGNGRGEAGSVAANGTVNLGNLTLTDSSTMNLWAWTSTDKDVSTDGKVNIAGELTLNNSNIWVEDGSYYFSAPINVVGSSVITSKWAKGIVIGSFNGGDDASLTLRSQGTDPTGALFTLGVGTEGESSFNGTLILDNSAAAEAKTTTLALNDSVALKNAALQLNSFSNVIIMLDRVLVESLYGSGDVARSYNNATGHASPVVQITGNATESQLFSGTVASTVTWQIGDGTTAASSRFSGATLNGALNIQANSTAYLTGSNTFGSLTNNGTLYLNEGSSFSISSVMATEGATITVGSVIGDGLVNNAFAYGNGWTATYDGDAGTATLSDTAVYWSDGGTDDNIAWSDGSNWSSGSVPASTDAVRLTADNAGKNIAVTSNVTVQELRLYGAYTMDISGSFTATDGYRFYDSASLTKNGTGTLNMTSAEALAAVADGKLTINAGTLHFTDTLAGNGLANNTNADADFSSLSIAANASLSIIGAERNGDSNIRTTVKLGSGFAGKLIVKGGWLDSDSDLGGASALVFDGGNLLARDTRNNHTISTNIEIGATGTTFAHLGNGGNGAEGTYYTTLSGSLAGSGDITFIENGDWYLTGDMSGFTGALIQESANMNLFLRGNAQNLKSFSTVNGTTLYVGTADNSVTVATGTGRTQSGNFNLDVAAGSKFTEKGTLNQTGGTFVVKNGGMYETQHISLASGTKLDVQGASTVNILGVTDTAFTMTAGEIAIATDAVVSDSRALTLDGNLSITGAGTYKQLGSLTINDGSTLTLSGKVTLSQLDNKGVITFADTLSSLTLVGFSDQTDVNGLTYKIGTVTDGADKDWNTLLGVTGAQISYDATTGLLTAGEAASLVWADLTGDTENSWNEASNWQDANGNTAYVPVATSTVVLGAGTAEGYDNTVTLTGAVEVASLTVQSNHNLSVAADDSATLTAAAITLENNATLTKTGEGTLVIGKDVTAITGIAGGTLKLDGALNNATGVDLTRFAGDGTLAITASGTSGQAQDGNKTGVTLSDSFTGTLSVVGGHLDATNTVLGGASGVLLDGGTLFSSGDNTVKTVDWNVAISDNGGYFRRNGNTSADETTTYATNFAGALSGSDAATLTIIDAGEWFFTADSDLSAWKGSIVIGGNQNNVAFQSAADFKALTVNSGHKITVSNAVTVDTLTHSGSAFTVTGADAHLTATTSDLNTKITVTESGKADLGAVTTASGIQLDFLKGATVTMDSLSMEGNLTLNVNGTNWDNKQSLTIGAADTAKDALSLAHTLTVHLYYDSALTDYNGLTLASADANLAIDGAGTTSLLGGVTQSAGAISTSADAKLIINGFNQTGGSLTTGSNSRTTLNGAVVLSSISNSGTLDLSGATSLSLTGFNDAATTVDGTQTFTLGTVADATEIAWNTLTGVSIADYRVKYSAGTVSYASATDTYIVWADTDDEESAWGEGSNWRWADDNSLAAVPTSANKVQLMADAAQKTLTLDGAASVAELKVQGAYNLAVESGNTASLTATTVTMEDGASLTKIGEGTLSMANATAANVQTVAEGTLQLTEPLTTAKDSAKVYDDLSAYTVNSGATLSVAAVGNETGAGTSNNTELSGVTLGENFRGVLEVRDGLITVDSNFGNAEAILLNGGGLIATTSVAGQHFAKNIIIGTNGAYLQHFGASGSFTDNWNTTIDGSISGSGTLYLTGYGEWHLAGDMSGFSGALVYSTSSHYLYVENDMSVSSLTMNAGGRGLIVGNASKNVHMVIGSVTDKLQNNEIRVITGSRLDISTGHVRIDGGKTLTISGGGMVNVSNIHHNAANAVLKVTDGTTVTTTDTGTYSLGYNFSTLIGANSTVNDARALGVKASSTFTVAGVNGGSGVYNLTSLNLWSADSQLTLNDAVQMNISGGIISGQGTINIAENASLNNNAALNVTGAFTLSGFGSFNQNAALSVGADGVLTLSGDVSILSLAGANAGTITLSDDIASLTLQDFVVGTDYAIGTVTDGETKDWNTLLGYGNNYSIEYVDGVLTSALLGQTVWSSGVDEDITWSGANNWKVGDNVVTITASDDVLLKTIAEGEDISSTIVIGADTEVLKVTVQDDYSLSVADGESHSFDAGTIVLDGGSLSKTGAGTLSMSLEDAVAAQMNIAEGTLNISDTLADTSPADVSPIDMSTLSGVGTLSITAAGLNGGTSDGTRTNVVLGDGFTGSLLVSGGQLDADSTIGGASLVVLDGATLTDTHGDGVHTVAWNIKVTDNDAYLRHFGYGNSDNRDSYATRLTGALTGSADAMLKVIDAGEWFLAGDMSGYQGGMSITGSANYVTFENSATLASLSAVSGSHILVDNNATLTAPSLSVAGTVYTGATEGATFNLGAVTIANNATLEISGAGNHTATTVDMSAATTTLKLGENANLTVSGMLNGDGNADAETLSITLGAGAELNLEQTGHIRTVGTTVNIALGDNAVMTDNAWRRLGNSSLTITGSGVYHLEGLQLSNGADGDTNVTIGAGATLHITGAANNNDGDGGALLTGTQTFNNTITVRGTLALECGVSRYNLDDTANTISVENGGKLAFNRGLTAANEGASAEKDVINIAGGAVLEVSGTNTTGSNLVTVNMAQDSILMGGNANNATESKIINNLNFANGAFIGAKASTTLTIAPADNSTDLNWVDIIGTGNSESSEYAELLGATQGAGGKVVFDSAVNVLWNVKVWDGATAEFNSSLNISSPNSGNGLFNHGTLIVDGAATARLFANDAGAEATFGSTVTLTESATNSGTLTVNGAFTANSVTNNEGGEATFNAGISLRDSAGTGATITNDGKLTVTGDTTMYCLRNNSGAEAVFNGTVGSSGGNVPLIYNSGKLTFNGNVDWMHQIHNLEGGEMIFTDSMEGSYDALVNAGKLVFDGADNVDLLKSIQNSGTVEVLNASGTRFTLADAMLTANVDNVVKTWTLVDNGTTGTLTGWDTLTLENFLLNGAALEQGDWDAVSIADGKVSLYMLYRYWDSADGDSNVWDTNSGTVWRDRETMEGLVYESGSRVAFGEYEDVDDINQGTGTTPLNKNVTVAEGGVVAKALDVFGEGYVFSGGKVTVTQSMSIQESAEFASTLVIGSTTSPLAVDVWAGKTLTVGTLETSSSVSYGSTIYNNGALSMVGEGTMHVTDALNGTFTQVSVGGGSVADDGTVTPGGVLKLGVAATDDATAKTITLAVGNNELTTAGGTLQNVVLTAADNSIAAADSTLGKAVLTDVSLEAGAAAAYATLQDVSFAGNSALSGYIALTEPESMQVAAGGTLSIGNLTLDLAGTGLGEQVVIANGATTAGLGILNGWTADKVSLVYNGVAVNEGSVTLSDTAGKLSIASSDAGALYWDGIGADRNATGDWNTTAAAWNTSEGADGTSTYKALSDIIFGAPAEGGSKTVTVAADMDMLSFTVKQGGYSFSGAGLTTLGDMSIAAAGGDVSFLNTMTAAGKLTTSGTGKVTFSEAVTVAGDVTLGAASTDIASSMASADGDIAMTSKTINVAGAVTAENGDITITSGNSEHSGEGRLALTSTGSLTAQNISIHVDAGAPTDSDFSQTYVDADGAVTATDTLTLTGTATKDFTGGSITADKVIVNTGSSNLVKFATTDIGTLTIESGSRADITVASAMDTIVLKGTLGMTVFAGDYAGARTYNVVAASADAYVEYATIAKSKFAVTGDTGVEEQPYGSITFGPGYRELTITSLEKVQNLNIGAAEYWARLNNATGGIHGNFTAIGGSGVELYSNDIMAETNTTGQWVLGTTLKLLATTQTLRGNTVNMSGAVITGNADAVGLSFAESSVINYGGSNTISANMTVAADKTLTLKAGYAAAQDQTVVAQSSDDTLLLSGALSGSGTLNLTGDGVVTISNANSGYTGTVTVGGGSSLELTNANALSAAAISVAGDGTLVLNAGAPVNVAGLAIADGASLSLIGLAPTDAADLTAAGLINANANGITWNPTGDSMTLNVFLDKEVENMMTYNLFTDKQALASSGVTLNVYHNGELLDASQYNVGYDADKKLVYIRTMIGNIWSGGTKLDGETYTADGIWALAENNTDGNWSGKNYTDNKAAIFVDAPTTESDNNYVKVTLTDVVSPGDVYFEADATYYQLISAADDATAGLAAGTDIHKAGSAYVNLSLANNGTMENAIGNIDLQNGHIYLGADLAVSGEVVVAKDALLRTYEASLVTDSYTAKGDYSNLVMQSDRIAGESAENKGVISSCFADLVARNVSIVANAGETVLLENVTLKSVSSSDSDSLTNVTIGSNVDVTGNYTLKGAMVFNETLTNTGTVTLDAAMTAEIGQLGYSFTVDDEGASWYTYQLVQGGTINGMSDLLVGDVTIGGVSLGTGLAEGVATYITNSNGSITLSIGKVTGTDSDGNVTSVDGSIGVPQWDERWGAAENQPSLSRRYSGTTADTNVSFAEGITDDGDYYWYSSVVNAENADKVNGTGNEVVVTLSSASTGTRAAGGSSEASKDLEMWVYDRSGFTTVIAGQYADAATDAYKQSADTHVLVNSTYDGADDDTDVDEKTWVVGGSWNVAQNANSYVTVQDGKILTLVGGSKDADQVGTSYVYIDGGRLFEVTGSSFASEGSTVTHSAADGETHASRMVITGGTLGGAASDGGTKSVYGGGIRTAITGDIWVTVDGTASITNLVGGNYGGSVTGNITLDLVNGTVATVHAAGNGSSTVTGNVLVNLGKDFVVSGGLYGGRENDSGVSSISGSSTLNFMDAGATYDVTGYSIQGFDTISLADGTYVKTSTGSGFATDSASGLLTVSGGGTLELTGTTDIGRDIKLEDGATLWFNSDHAGNNIGTQNSRSTLTATAATTIDITGQPGEGDGLCVWLDLAGHGVDNKGALYKGLVGAATDPSGKVALPRITLSDSASINAVDNIYVIECYNAEAELFLQGNTLTKVGANKLTFFNTTVDTGNIYVKEGTLGVGYSMRAESANVILGGGSTLDITSAGDTVGTAKIGSLSGSGDTNLSYILQVTTNDTGNYIIDSDYMTQGADAYGQFSADTGFAYGVYSGKISGESALYVSGDGAQYLSGNESTYSGGTHLTDNSTLYLLGSTEGSATKGSSSVTSGVLGTGAIAWDSADATLYLGNGVRVYNNGVCNADGSSIIIGVEGAPVGAKLAEDNTYLGVHSRGTNGINYITLDDVEYVEVATHNLQSISCDGMYADGTAYVAGTEIDRNKMLLVSRSDWEANTATVTGFSGNGYNEATYSGVLSGNVSFEKVGIGTLVLDQANEYTGSTTISEGSLVLKGWAQIGSAADGASINVEQKAGTSLVLAYDGSYGDEITGIANNITLTGEGDARWKTDAEHMATSALISDVGSSVRFTLSGDISGDGGILHSGAGTLVLSGDSSYSGGTHASNGVVEVQSATGLGSGVVTVDSTSDLHVTVEDGTTADRLATTIKAAGSSVKGDVVINGTDTTERILNIAVSTNADKTEGYSSFSTTVGENGTLLLNGDGITAETGKLSGSGTVAVSDATAGSAGAKMTVSSVADFTGDFVVEGKDASIDLQTGAFRGGSISVSGTGANVTTKGDVIIVSGESLSLTSKGNVSGNTDTSASVQTTGAVNVTNGATLSVAAAETSYEYNLQNLQASASLDVGSDLESGAEGQAYTAMGTSAEEVYKGFFNTSVAMNQKAAGSVDAEGGLTLSGGASYETSMANTSLMGGTLTLDTTATSLLNFDTTLDAGQAAIDGSGRTTQLVLFSDVGGVNFVLDDMEADAGTGIYYTRADRYITGCGYVDEETWLVYDSSAQVVYLEGLIPEPTTATLSLLALAALAARRRRK